MPNYFVSDHGLLKIEFSDLGGSLSGSQVPPGIITVDALSPTTGNGAVVLSNSPTLTGTVVAAGLSLSGVITDGVGSGGISSQVLSSTGTETRWVDAGSPSFPLFAPNGSVSASSYSFQNSTDTGFFLESDAGSPPGFGLGVAVQGVVQAQFLDDGVFVPALYPQSLDGTLYADRFSGSDMGAKINGAIAALPAGGGTVIIPAGQYNVSTTITFSSQTQTLRLLGAGGGLAAYAQGLGTALTWVGEAAPMFSITSGGGAEIGQFSADNTGSGTVLLDIDNGGSQQSNSVTVHDIFCEPTTPFSTAGIRLGNSSGTFSPVDIRFNRVYLFSSAPIGYDIVRGIHVVMHQCRAVQHSNNDLVLGSSSQTVYDFSASQSSFEGGTNTDSILINQAEAASWNQCYFECDGTGSVINVPSTAIEATNISVSQSRVHGASGEPTGNPTQYVFKLDLAAATFSVQDFYATDFTAASPAVVHNAAAQSVFLKNVITDSASFPTYDSSTNLTSLGVNLNGTLSGIRIGTGNIILDTGSITCDTGDLTLSGGYFQAPLGNIGDLSGSSGVLKILNSSGTIYFEPSTDLAQDSGAPVHFLNPASGVHMLDIDTSGNISCAGNISTGGIYYAGSTPGVTQTAEAVGTLATIGGIVTTFTAVSDERLKVFETSSYGLDEILKISPIDYRWTDEGSRLSGQSTERDFVGFSAQNVRGVIPEAVHTTSDGYLGFDDRPVLAAAINAIKELSARLAVLEKSAQT